MNPSHFDYVIVGNGLAGLQLALKLASDSYFDNYKIALIDPSSKTKNDKTWSFWEKHATLWDSITEKEWEQATFISKSKEINLNLHPYRYKTIRSIDFYKNSKLVLSQKSNIMFITDTVTSLKETNNFVQIFTKHQNYTSKHVFDSRIPTAFKNPINEVISLKQHFKGYFIDAVSDVFNEKKLVMMDYRLKDGDQTTFMYVLPFSKRKALIEFTYFTEQLVKESVYDTYIKTYIKDYLHVDEYQIIETETGHIPMSTFNFEKFNTAKITKIGTGGGWVKASTGYSFKHTEKKVTQIVSNIKLNKTPSFKLFKKKYKFYDKVFLKVLKDENSKGEWVFQQLYNKNSIQSIFRFLDEESTIIDELKIMWSLLSWRFLKAFFKTL
jgi:lycopene beta-cyclase